MPSFSVPIVELPVTDVAHLMRVRRHLVSIAQLVLIQCDADDDDWTDRQLASTAVNQFAPRYVGKMQWLTVRNDTAKIQPCPKNRLSRLAICSRVRSEPITQSLAKALGSVHCTLLWIRPDDQYNDLPSKLLLSHNATAIYVRYTRWIPPMHSVYLQ